MPLNSSIYCRIERIRGLTQIPNSLPKAEIEEQIIQNGPATLFRQWSQADDSRLNFINDADCKE